jgi:hypothetical protein
MTGFTTCVGNFRLQMTDVAIVFPKEVGPETFSQYVPSPATEEP